MRRTTVQRWGPRRRASPTSRSGGPAADSVDRLSDLPDALLHHIMSSLKAWEVVRTCVLSRRWLHLWESAPCLDLRVCAESDPPRELRDFVHRLFLLRDVSAPLDTLCLQSSHEDRLYDEDDAITWIRVALKLNARVILLARHRNGNNSPPCQVLNDSHCLSLFDEMRGTTTKRWGPRRRASQTSRSAASVDRLSGLPDALLHHIVSSLKAWEVVRTCVLARRWRHLWKSAPCVDLRVFYPSRDSEPPGELRDFVHRLFLLRDVSAPVDTLCLHSSDEDESYGEDDSTTWIKAAIKRNARVIHLAGHRKDLALLDHTVFVSSQLKIVKLSYARLDDSILRQLSARCTSLEELDLSDCLMTGCEIVSTSLKTLSMVKCKINVAFSIAAPNLLSLRLISPYFRVPSFKNMGSLVTGTIILNPFFLSDDFEHFSEDETTDDEDDYGFGHGFYRTLIGPGGYKNNIYGYGSDIESDEDTYEYRVIAKELGGMVISRLDEDYHGDFCKDGNSPDYGEKPGCNDSKVLGGHNVLGSLSNARSLELLTTAREVVLRRELKRCPTFSNLKTLYLGEWCMAAGFDALVFLLQHSPNIERLFVQLQLNLDTRNKSENDITVKEKSFACKHLQMVKIKCSKDDVRVHKLAHLFRANGISLGKISVRRSGSFHLRSKMEMREHARHEIEFWGMDDDPF